MFNRAFFHSKSAVERFEDTFYIVEATSFEQHCLWEFNSIDSPIDSYRRTLKWEQLDGYIVTIGYVNNFPVCLSLSWVLLNGKPVMFYDPTSLVVDYAMIESYFIKHFPDYYKMRTDAQNFHQCVHAIQGEV